MWKNTKPSFGLRPKKQKHKLKIELNQKPQLNKHAVIFSAFLK